MIRVFLFLLISFALSAQSIDWAKIDAETLKHFSALIQINSADPGGSEKPVVDYIKGVLDKD